jgi:hypothetical protein
MGPVVEKVAADDEQQRRANQGAGIAQPALERIAVDAAQHERR